MYRIVQEAVMLNQKICDDFFAVLKEELVPALGCTEPIALAYAGAKLRDILGEYPERIVARCSGSLIKNVRCVQIPNSQGHVGIEAALALGVFGGDAQRDMQVLSAVTEESRRRADAFLQEERCSVYCLDSDIPLHFIVEGCCGSDSALIEIRYTHLNITRIEKNGEVLLNNETGTVGPTPADRSALNIANIKAFADEAPFEKLEPIYDQVVRMNMDIAYEGMSGGYGLCIGKMLRESYPDSTITRMKAFAAAGSEARMDGCELPVIINSGSGNQGIASTVPVIVYCRENSIPRERMYRALAFSSLATVFQKEFIGTLSAFCGAVSASCASGAAITYLCNGTVEQIENTISNTLADIPGIICDGAKTSCAIKIATCLDAAMMAHHLAMRNHVYSPLTGILRDSADETVSSVGYLARVGMYQTNKEILKVMMDQE